MKEIVALGLLACASAAGAWQVPIQLTRGHLVLTTITVEGRELRALVDTGGANGIELSQSVAESLKLKLEYGPYSLRRYAGGVKHVLVGKVKSLGIGDFAASDHAVEVVHGDLERISTLLRTRVDAIIGWGFLARYYLSLDYTGGVMKFDTSPWESIEPSVEISFETASGNGPVVEGKLDGQTTRFLIDTGAPRSSFDPGSKGRDAPPTRKEIGLEGRSTFLIERPRDLSALAQAHAEAVLGNDFLAGWIIKFDPAKKLLALFKR